MPNGCLTFSPASVNYAIYSGTLALSLTGQETSWKYPAVALTNPHKFARTPKYHSNFLAIA
jgi:hypothetical protein